jgi:hypothetical protein
MFGLLMTNEIRKMHEDSVHASWSVDQYKTTRKEFSFDGFMVVPGGKDSYTLRLTPVASVVADLIIDFNEDQSKLTENELLRNHVTVQVKVDDKIVIEGLLAEVFANPYKQKKSITEKKPFYIDITFSLPEDAGNEFKNAHIYFDLVVTVENQIIGDY